MSLKVLLAFPDSDYSKEIYENFKQDPNYQLVLADTIEDALDKIEKNQIDICLIDMHFEDGTGLDLKQKMCEIKDLPTIVVSDEDDGIKIVLALEYGADDYMVVPINILELKARVRAVLRRLRSYTGEYSQDASNIIQYGQFEFNIIGQKVKLGGKHIDLTGKEFDLLYTMVSHAGTVFSREQLAEELWGISFDGHLRTVDVHIKRLRKKINDTDSSLICTKWGEGYYYGKE